MSGQIVYSIIVYAAGEEGALNCGAPGQTMTPQATWDNSRVQELSLTFNNPEGLASQASAFDPPQDKALGDPAFAISTQAPSRLPVSSASIYAPGL